MIQLKNVHDLDKLVKCSEKWQILLFFGKCKSIHIGHGNMNEVYTIGLY